MTKYSIKVPKIENNTHYFSKIMGIKTSKPNLKTNTTRAQYKQITRSSCQLQGWPEYMEDFILIEEQEDYQVYAIFDGHGGCEVSQFLSEYFCEILARELLNKDYEQALYNTFQTLDMILAKQITSSYVGSTAIILLVTNEKLYVANLGDSRAILISKDDCQSLSTDHTIDYDFERITNQGGYIIDGRINGSLTVARAFGDFFLKHNSIISVIPEISIYNRPLQNQQVFLASDGIWECENNEQIKQRLLKGQSLQYILQQLVAKNDNQDRGFDNMSAILIQF